MNPTVATRHVIPTLGSGTHLAEKQSTGSPGLAESQSARSPGRLRRSTAINSGRRPEAKVFRPISRLMSAFIGIGAFYNPRRSHETRGS